MNYGRYFRLNQALSKVVDGVAIYDYIDLPAYFGPSEDNPMSPKYPISVTVSSDAVCFRLHYSAFKIEKKEGYDDFIDFFSENENNCDPKHLFTIFDDFPHYAYNKDDIENKSIPKVYKNGLTDMDMAHMEEIILELPYTDIITGKLSQTIKDIYNTTFPQVMDDNTSMGGRYLEQIIRKRYPSLNQKKESGTEGNNIEKQLYDELRIVSDDTASYSTLWLMDLYKEGRIDLYEIIKDKVSGEPRKIIVGFLRKLLLDFMFDLKHSDVFQNNANYQKMYSGLMSDFYFSALMHKCEYYYCRKLILEEITHLESAKKDATDKDEIEKRKNCIKVLYANNLFKAEQVWVNDIMSPQAEKDFDFLHPKPKEPETHVNNEKKSFLSKTKELFRANKLINKLIRDQFRRWDSWFAPPEEEMKRVCFGMKEENPLEIHKIHTCNTDTLASYLKINNNTNNNDDDKLDKELSAIRSEIRESISRWFLRRNDFHDTAHLHLSKCSNWALVVFLLFLVALLYIIPCIVVCDYFESSPLKSLQHYFPMCVMLTGIAFVYSIFSCCWKKKDKKEECNDNPLYKESRSLSKRRVTILFVGLALLSILINSFWMAIAIIFLLIIACSLKKNKQDYMRFYFNKLISCLHLFFPRLVASITTAWLTITLGFDLYSSFFDKPISWPTAFFVSIVILMFIMFEINQITPRVNLWRKILRSLELLLISWCISILVGVVVIDFVGERYIERGGYIENFFAEYVVDENGVDKLSSPTNTDNKLRTNMVDNLTDYKPIVVKFILGEHDVFYMRDFLFMFSFITMFMGIFLQMFIFDDKKMTEF